MEFGIEAGWVWLFASAHTSTQKLKGRYSSVILGSRLSAGQLEDRVSIPGTGRNNIQTGSGAQPASYPVDTECCFSVKEADRARK
jgi:hypothetical protein